jgi:hypothetical protein
MQEDLSANYIVVNDIDASGTVNWNNGKGFNAIGGWDNDGFIGSFDGQNHTISNLSINRVDAAYVGLFGRIGEGGEVKNVGVINVNMTGESDVGGLAGRNYYGNISNSYSTGNVTGVNVYVGGLVGFNNEGNISNSYSTGNVTGEKGYVGGLVGQNDEGKILNSYSTGNVTGESYDVGGLVGFNSNGNISNSYSTGNVSGELYNVGGLVGETDGTVSNSYWNSDSTITEDSTEVPTEYQVGVPLTTSQMQGSSASSSMSGFDDFTDTWSTVEGDYPELQWQE